ncbi:MAG TPA: pilus assembly protein TadG-related protein, partial [Chloroflexota bacterium]
MRHSARRRQAGQAMAIMAVVIVAIVGTMAFVVDLGFQMEARRALQNAADAGALAGVALLPDDQSGSIQQATTFAYQD